MVEAELVASRQPCVETLRPFKYPQHDNIGHSVKYFPFGEDKMTSRNRTGPLLSVAGPNPRSVGLCRSLRVSCPLHMKTLRHLSEKG